jgi:2-phospho-L-lactate guanylyltransferase
MAVADTPLAWSLVIPVKVLARAKSRLTGLAGARRPELALALAADTVAAAVGCPEVAAVIVVSDDPAAAAELAGLGARVVPDEPDDGLNPALVHGAAVASGLRPAAATAALAADLPALRPDELGRALRAAAAWPEAFVADAAGSGTTLYTAAPGSRFRPRFGPGSRQRHRSAGVAELDLAGIPGLRRDVDTAADLSSASGLGLGPRTAAIAPQLLGSIPGRSAGRPG